MSSKNNVQSKTKPSKRPSSIDIYKAMGSPGTSSYALEYLIRKNNEATTGETLAINSPFLMPKYLPVPIEIKPSILSTVIITLSIFLMVFHQYILAVLAFTIFIVISLKRWKSTNQKAFKIFIRGNDLFERRKYDEALKLFTQAAQVFPASPGLQLLLGKLTAYFLDFAKSFEHYSNYLESNPDDQDTRVQYAASLLAAKNPGKALSILQSLPADARNSLPVATLMGSCLLELNTPEEALEIMENISLENETNLETDKDTLFFRYILATAYQKLSRNNEALEQYRLIHAQDKDFLNVAKLIK